MATQTAFINTQTAAIPAYAGFWRRVLAWWLDSIAIAIITMICFAPFAAYGQLFAAPSEWSLAEFFFRSFTDESVRSNQWAFWDIVFMPFFGPLIYGAMPLSLLAQLLYYAAMESSRRQATIGKLLLGLRVTDLQGRRISFWRALGRNLPLLFLSYAMALSMPFSRRRRGVHDLLAGTVVIKIR
ncbi:MAG: RDD family protein [Oscillochloridaceae bacterium umkhey_bin13]